jgi:hypothetical protein
MKMKERGIGTTVIIIIVVAVVIGTVIPVTIAAVLLGGGGGVPSELTYSGATLLQSANVSGVAVATYDIGTADGSTVYNTIKSQAQAAGWTITQADTYLAGYGGLFQCTKGNDQASVSVLEGSYATQAASAAGSNASKVLVVNYTPGTTSAPC